MLPAGAPLACKPPANLRPGLIRPPPPPSTRRNATSSNLMYIKEDIIMPHTMSFYELIVNKAQARLEAGWGAWRWLALVALHC